MKKPTKTIKKVNCYSCDFQRNCSDYKGIMLCDKCLKEAQFDANEEVQGSSLPTH